MLSRRQIRSWQAFDALEPIGEWRADFRTGLLASLVANMAKGRDDRLARPIDFMPFATRPGPDRAAIAQKVKRVLGVRGKGG